MTRTIGTIFFVLIIGALAGASYSYMIDGTLNIEGMLNRGMGTEAIGRGAVRGTLVASVAGAMGLVVHHSPLGRWLDARTFGSGFLLRGVVTTAILLVALTGTHLILVRNAHHFTLWMQYALPRDLPFVVVVTLILQILLQTRRLIGARTWVNYLLGRYRQPFEEHRIFLLADIVGSTDIASKLGDKDALSLITSFFTELDPIINRHAGEVHAYVGDEVIISWGGVGANTTRNALNCVADILDLVERRRDHYMGKYGIAPAVRIGLCGGAIAVGECGGNKPQVVYIGDTLNTAKRLQESCKNFGVQVLMDHDTVRDVSDQHDHELCYIGQKTLRGHAQPTELFTIGTSHLAATLLRPAA